MLAFLVLCLALDICSSIIQSSPWSCNVSCLRATFSTHSAAAAGKRCATWGHMAGFFGEPFPRMSHRLSAPSLREVLMQGASEAKSARTPPYVEARPVLRQTEL